MPNIPSSQQSQIDKPLEKPKFRCQYDKSSLKLRCPACLKINRGNRAKTYHSPNSLYGHLVQCFRFQEITKPTRAESIQMLENLSIANSYGMVGK